MSKENVALFVRMLTEKKDLNKRAAAERSSRRWVEIAHDAGVEFTPQHLANFVGEVLRKPVTVDNAVPEFLTAMTGSDLNAEQRDHVVSGAVSSGGITFSTSLASAMTRAGYVKPGGIGGDYTFPPDHSRLSGGLPGGGVRDPAP